MAKLKIFFDFLFTNTEYVILGALILFTVVLILSLASKRWRAHRDIQANLLLVVLLLLLLLILGAVDGPIRWELLIGLLPSILVVYQAFYLWLYQPKPAATPGPSPEVEVLKPYRDEIFQLVSSHFGLRTLFTRYCFPAVLLGIAGIILLRLVVNPVEFVSVIRVLREQGLISITVPDAQRIMLGVKLGSIGAYTFVLLELGRRTFRHDITGASAMWCLVTLVLGPVLAATVAVLWRMDGPQDNNWWGAGVVLFFAGFAPRRVMAAIEQAAVQLLKIGTTTGVVETRLIPLNKVRGIGPQIEERLSEEGVVDVNSLAAAEPVRLLRNTSFDMRQILSWIDEAILIVTLPRSWEAVEEAGITGAIDLAWYFPNRLSRQDWQADPNAIPAEIRSLADKCKMDLSSFASTIQRLYEDTQVRYIWTMYNNFTEYSGGTTPQLQQVIDQHF